MIKEFERRDLRPTFEYFEEEKAKTKALSSVEKKELKKQKDEMEAKYVTCLLDGRKEKVGNFRVELPGLFRGRGGHPPYTSGKSLIDNTHARDRTENISGNHKYVLAARAVRSRVRWFEKSRELKVCFALASPFCVTDVRLRVMSNGSVRITRLI